MRTVTVCLVHHPRTPFPLFGERPDTPSVRVVDAGIRPGPDVTFAPGLPVLEIAGFMDFGRPGRPFVSATMKERAVRELRHAQRIGLALPDFEPGCFELLPLLAFVRDMNPRALICVSHANCEFLGMPEPATATDGRSEPWTPIDDTPIEREINSECAYEYAARNLRAAVKCLSSAHADYPKFSPRETASRPDIGIAAVQMLFAVAKGRRLPFDVPRLAETEPVVAWATRLFYSTWHFVRLERNWIVPADDGWRLEDEGANVLAYFSPDLDDARFFERSMEWDAAGLDGARDDIDTYARRFHDVQRAFLADGKNRSLPKAGTAQ